jgi:hypothetical protein
MTAYTYKKLISWSRGALRLWQQDALRRVLEGRVTDADIKEIAGIALYGILGREDPRAKPANASHVRPSGKSLPSVTLLGIRDIQRVNALGPGPIAFSGTGLTVIYGENASGKTGFSRILKKACRARAPESAIRGNVFEPPSPKPPAATIDFSVDGTHDSAVWEDGSPSRDTLALVTIFDADCARWQVDRPNTIEYTPELLAVFRDLATVFRRVGTALQSRKAEIPSRPAILDELKTKLETGTSAWAFLDSLSANSNPKELVRLSTLNDAERKRIAELAEVLRADPAAEWREEEARGRRVMNLGRLCQTLEVFVSDTACERLASIIEKAIDAEEAVQTARAILSGNSKLEGVGGEIWRRLWEAARTYSQQLAFPGEAFPVIRDGALCVLCQQSLDEQAKKRLRSFEEFVQGEVQQHADVARAELDATVKSISSMPIPKRSRDAVRDIGLLESEKGCEIRLFLISVKRRRSYLLALASGRKVKDRPMLSPIPDLNPVRTAIDERIRILQIAANAEGRQALVAQQNELSARTKLSTYQTDVANEISRLVLIAFLDTAISECNTHGVTLEQGAAEKALVTSKLQDRFRTHLVNFGFSELQVDLLPQGGEQGKRPYGCRVTANPAAPAGEVLCEGERTCVALAGILAELDITENRSGIVLDDPVCSLDHNYRERIARHLTEEAQKRQVIIFTHDIVFLFLLERYAGSKGVTFQAMTLRRGGSTGGHGQVESEPPWESMRVKERVARMRRTVTAARQLWNSNAAGYEKEARDVYTQLRQTWERAVEEVLLNSAILRFGQAVETQRLRKVAGDLSIADVQAVDESMSYCSKFMHDPPGNVSRERPPGPDIVEADIKRLDDWARAIWKRRESSGRAQA